MKHNENTKIFYTTFFSAIGKNLDIVLDKNELCYTFLFCFV